MTTWVLLRGLARESRHWGTLPAMLQQALPPGDRVLALDLPGNGERWRERSPMHVEGLLSSVRGELATRDVAMPCAVVGLSLGAMVAMHWAHTRPDELQACVLINSSARGLSAASERLRLAAAAALARGLLPGVAPERRERIVWRVTSTREPDERTLSQWVAYARSSPVRRINVLRQLVAAQRFRAPRILPVPALVLASARDGLVSPRCSAVLARAWRLPLREHPHAGHDLPLDAPHWVVQQITAWHSRRLR